MRSPFRRSAQEISPFSGVSTAGSYTVDAFEGASPPGFDVFRVEITTGHRTIWKTLMPWDPVGVQGIRNNTVITPGARSYCYSHLRRLGDLFVVDGLQ
jgi:hypothetical protein